MKKTIKLIELSSDFKLPENAEEIIFLKNMDLCSGNKISVKIEKCSIGKSFYLGKERMIFIKGFKYLIHCVPNENMVYSKGVKSKTYVDYVSFKNLKVDFTIYNKTNWCTLFPEQLNDLVSNSVGKDLYLLKNTDYRSLTPPIFENVFKNVLKYCEGNEFYEICASLMKFATDWFVFYEHRFEKEPLLKFTQGWGWLYHLNKRVILNSPQLDSKLLLVPCPSIK